MGHVADSPLFPLPLEPHRRSNGPTSQDVRRIMVEDPIGRIKVEPKKSADEEEDVLADALKALGHPKRLRLLRFVTEPRSIDEIASHIQLARQSAQEHLDRVLEFGLVEARRGEGDHGPITHYVLSVSRVFDVWDRLGSRLGMLDARIDEDVRPRAPTTRLSEPASSPSLAQAPRLIIVHGMRIGRTIPFHGSGPWLIGRDPNATFCLDYDPYVSHRHAEVRRTTKGFELADGLSSNGTMTDWKILPRGGTSELQNGSIIRVGKTLLLFKDR